MPSNAYKISRLILELQAKLADQGDLDCVLVSQGEPVAIDGGNIIPTMTLPGGRLNAPVLAFGLTLDGNVQTNMPGARYMVDSVDEDGWNHDLSAAPVDTDVDVWRRFFKGDHGHCDADGRWFVYAGGDTAVECARQGIFAWRPK